MIYVKENANEDDLLKRGFVKCSRDVFFGTFEREATYCYNEYLWVDYYNEIYWNNENREAITFYD